MELIGSSQHISRIAGIITILASLIMWLAFPATGMDLSGNNVFQLLTVEEAVRPAARTAGFSAPLADSGPVIGTTDLEIVEGKPFTLVVNFEARDGVQPDVSTLKLECLKSQPIDLTPRIKPFVTLEGVTIDKTLLPAGLHKFRVSISDARGRMSEKDFVVTVSGAF